MDKTDQTPLLIVTITEQRSGSKWFGSLIRDATGASCIGEAFLPSSESIISFERFAAQIGLVELNRMGIAEALDRYFGDLSTYLGRLLHCDLMFNQREWLSFGWTSAGVAIYEYLKSRDAIVISLLRDEKSVFLSQKALPLIGQAHFFDDEEPKIPPSREVAALSAEEYQHFCEVLKRNRTCLTDAMVGYERFIEVRYDDICRTGELPPSLIKLVSSAAAERGLPVDSRGRVTTARSPRPSRIDYSALFSNADRLMG